MLYTCTCVAKVCVKGLTQAGVGLETHIKYQQRHTKYKQMYTSNAELYRARQKK